MYLSLHLILGLPLVVRAAISVTIEADPSPSNCKVEVKGEDKHVITDDEIDDTGMTDRALKNGVENYMGGRPSDVFLKGPTPGVSAPGNDLYKEYQWPEVTIKYKAEKAEVIGIDKEPVIIATQNFHNENPKNSVKFKADINQKIEQSVQESWSSSGSFRTEVNVSVRVSVVKASTSFIYSSSWGKDKTEKKSITVGTSTGMEIELQPLSSAVASLTATRGEMNCKVYYSVKLDGVLAANYPKTFKGHHYYQVPIKTVMKYADLPSSWETISDMKCGFFTGATVKVT